jgi:alkylhydroperoxidase family enzyme
MEPMHLPQVEHHKPESGHYKDIIANAPPGQIPQIMHLFAWRPEATQHLSRFTQAIMREARELSAGQCELIAAVVSGKNDCLF